MNQVEVKIGSESMLIPCDNGLDIFNTIRDNLYARGELVKDVIFGGRRVVYSPEGFQKEIDNNNLIFHLVTYKNFVTKDMVDYLINDDNAEFIRNICDFKPIATLNSSIADPFHLNYINKQEIRNDIPVIELLFSEWMNENKLNKTNSSKKFNIKIYMENSPRRTQILFYDEPRLEILANILEIELDHILWICSSFDSTATDYEKFVIYMTFGDFFGKSPCKIDIVEYCENNPEFEEKIIRFKSVFNI